MSGDGRRNVFEGAPLDRAPGRRDDEEYLRRVLRSEETRVVLVREERTLASVDEPAASVLLRPHQLPRDSLEEETWVFLGVGEDGPYVALDATDWDEDELEEAVAGAGRWADLHRMGARLDDRDASVLAYARGLLTWHRRHRFCGRCGAATQSTAGGHTRRCAACGATSFPRTDPAIIVLVAEGRACLLGRQAEWPEGVFSTFAGFVEPGESLREAVRREVREEAGVDLQALEFHSSQPWPFPSSLMIGFTAATRGRPAPRVGEELEAVRWFDRRELEDLRASGEVRLPPPVSIARRMIDEWLAGEVSAGESPRSGEGG